MDDRPAVECSNVDYERHRDLSALEIDSGGKRFATMTRNISFLFGWKSCNPTFPRRSPKLQTIRDSTPQVNPIAVLH